MTILEKKINSLIISFKKKKRQTYTMFTNKQVVEILYSWLDEEKNKNLK